MIIATLSEIIHVNEDLEKGIILIINEGVSNKYDHMLTFCNYKTQIDKTVKKGTLRNLKLLDFVTSEHRLSLTRFQSVFL